MPELTLEHINFNERLIILDRDGVINYDSDNYIRSPQEWNPIPNSLQAIARLNQAGFRVAIATNQSGIGRGYYTEEVLASIHKKMLDLLALEGGKIDIIFYCPHLPSDHCECRKPKPGLLHQIAHHFQCTSLANIPFIGDSACDIDAAIAAHALPIHITPQSSLNHPYPHFYNLNDAVNAILAALEKRRTLSK